MSTCNRLDLQTLGSWPVMPKNLPDHRCEVALRLQYADATKPKPYFRPAYSYGLILKPFMYLFIPSMIELVELHSRISEAERVKEPWLVWPPGICYKIQVTNQMLTLGAVWTQKWPTPFGNVQFFPKGSRYSGIAPRMPAVLIHCHVNIISTSLATCHTVQENCTVLPL